MSHLGQRLSALIDSELSDFERDRVLAHLAGCDECRGEAIALRALKQRIHALGETMADTALTGRLMAMAAADERSPWGSRATWRAGHRAPPVRYLAAGIFTVVVVSLGTMAFVVGGGDQQPSGPKVTPRRCPVQDAACDRPRGPAGDPVSHCRARASHRSLAP